MNFNFQNDLWLEDDRVLLRPLEREDLAGLVPAASGDALLVQYSPYSIHTPELLRNYIETALEDRDRSFRFPFAIYDKATGTFAGSTCIANVSNKDRRLEIGWTWLGRDFQKTGLNRHCKFLLLQYVFETLQFERVEFKTDERNLASRAALEKIGAVYEGALRSHTVMNDGFRRTTVYYSILREEWEQLKPTFLERRT
ncbi:MAG TPA: GNAT family protein [Flavisolibacter sp.]